MARELAVADRECQRVPRSSLRLPTTLFSGRLEDAHGRLADGAGDRTLPKASEWFLDNYYLLRRAARQVDEELPRGFRSRLPHLATGPSKGHSRVASLSSSLVLSCNLVLDLTLLLSFVDSYQAVTPLTIAELWAFPTVLRATVLEQLLTFLAPARASAENGLGEPEGRGASLPLVSLAISSETGVERSVRALRVIDEVDWKEFFERTNRVEAILREDPDGVYPRMDFETCDSYRKVVEDIAWVTGHGEPDVAQRAIALSQSSSKIRAGHVGYHLIGGGRSALEAQFGYRSTGLERFRRIALRWPTVSYLLPLALLTFVPVLAGALALRRAGALSLLSIVVVALVAVVPVSAISVAFLSSFFARLLRPRTLPKLDFEKGLDPEAKTLVVMPTLLGRSSDVDAMLRRIELHYLANPDPKLDFALLTDNVDATSAEPKGAGDALLDAATEGISALNEKHKGSGTGPFHLLHRTARWNPGEGRFMGWERKRGKLDELNRLLRGDTATSYSRHVGSAQGLLDVRFVITLDADTELPMGAAHRLAGTLAHPLNQAVFDPATGRVTAGYTIAQPRVETSPSSARETPFSRLFAGRIGFDIYTHACSELYQDLFGSGIYVGKGIYDVDAFMKSVEGRVPDNSLVSHDLFEGIHGRAALLSDVAVFEGYPATYATYALRSHRWLRGDWQLLPWVFRRVPSQGGKSLYNRLSAIDRWKIIDNLRRSVAGPFVLALLVAGWLQPKSALSWTIVALSLLLAPLLPALSGRGRRLEHLGRCALAVVLLVHETAVVADAVARVAVRSLVTRQHLLQWRTDADAAFDVATTSSRARYWRTMAASPLFAAGLVGILWWLRASSLAIAAPVLTLWLAAPEVARRISEPRALPKEHITDADRRALRLLARRTWRFFDTFIGPQDQWLPIDNYQADPHEKLAHRTSPTNMGLALLATLSAYDFGYLGASELAVCVRRAFDSLAKMEHYRGHLFNWYDTRNLQPLLPRYVSTVDSGNFAGCLLALGRGCADLSVAPLVRVEAWDGVLDSIDLLDQAVVPVPSLGLVRLHSVIGGMRDTARATRRDLRGSHAAVSSLIDTVAGDLERELLSFLEAGGQRHEADVLRSLRTSIDTLRQQLQQMRRELDALLPWLWLRDDAAAYGLELPVQLRLDEVSATASTLGVELDARASAFERAGELTSELAGARKRLDESFRVAARNADALEGELAALGRTAHDEAGKMDFKLLYDLDRKLFHIGHNVTSDQVDSHHYDLLASEARLASYVAIVKRDVPESHWFMLGRPMTHLGGAFMLLSWGGTMFEYLMPALLMRSQAGTLIARTNALAVDMQIAHGKESGEPWGVSESSYARLDVDKNYQYRSFGVPGLGLKRGLEADRVVTPYASILAVSLRPKSVVDNLGTLAAMGMLGTYGLFEALDFTPGRALEHPPHGSPFAVVRSYMAHHQGMLLVALGNFLNQRTMVDRFHANALVETGDLLLNEYAPDTAPVEKIGKGRSASTSGDLLTTLPHPPGPWPSLHSGSPQAFVLSNGSLTSLVTDSGGGGLRWNGLDLTRYEPDVTLDEDGIWFFLRDEESGHLWRATSPAGRTTFAMHNADYQLREQGISVHVEITVAAYDDVELRTVTLHNETNRPRRLTMTSVGRPVLFDAKQAPTHPVFSSMFVESEYLASLDGLLFARRPQSPEEEPAVLVHFLAREGTDVAFAGFETDRFALAGRGRAASPPETPVIENEVLFGRVGAVLDPVMSLMARVALAPNGSVVFAFVTTVGRSRHVALSLAKKYQSMHAVRWAVRDAAQQGARLLARTKVEPSLVPTVQRLFSAILFDDPKVRATADERAKTPPCQRRLWGLGISGDEPIVLLRVRDVGSRLVEEVLSAQRYLREGGVHLDLVLVDEHASEYVMEGALTLESILSENDTKEWLGRHGGIFVLTADKLAAPELLHLEACARVLLDTRDGSLADHLARERSAPPKLPRFQPTRVDDSRAQSRARPTLVFDNGIGGFSEDGREYVTILGPGTGTPAPWCNVLTNPDFGCLVSESGLGATWSLNSGENRLTPWRNDPVKDTPSEVLYMRDEETADVWSPTPLPAGTLAETRVRHGAGYTVYESEAHGLIQEMTVFVPSDAPLKIVRLRLKNTLSRPRRLTVTYYAEWVLGSRRKRQSPYIVSELDRQNGCLLASCEWSAEFSGRIAFLASKESIHGVTADRTEFLGRRGGYAHPEGLERWGLSGRVDLGADPCAALQVHLEVAAGEDVETHFVLGQASDRAEALRLVTRFRDESTVAAAWEALHAYWDTMLGAVRVKTPERSMDLMLNRWLLYQTLSARLFGRTGFYQSSGAFGFRDQLQDVMALFHSAPELARAQIVRAAKHQFEEGDVLHWWHPPSGRGVRTRCSDDMAWLPYVTAEYVAATGDQTILDEPLPFLRGSPLSEGEHTRYAEYAISEATLPLREHCRRALEHAITSGAHGLPLMGDGDWNDGMSRVGAKGVGESVWLAWFLSATMDRFATLSSEHDARAAAGWRSRADALRATTREVAWDGEWYVRAFHDDGSVVGSAKSEDCKIDSIAQSWAVLSQGRTENHDPRSRAAMAAVDEQLVRETDRLLLLFWPPFDASLHDPGYVRAYPPGVRENGGQYTHAGTWLGFAHAALGDGAAAERLFRLLNPILHARTRTDAAGYRVEPYVVAGDVYSCRPWVGRGGWTWYTGAAAWMWRLGVEQILGLRLEAGDMRIDPCIPPTWEGFEAWVERGSQSVHIVVENPERVARGIAAMTLDGHDCDRGRILLREGGGDVVEVRVRLGASSATKDTAA